MYHGVEAEPVRPRCSYVLDVATLRQQLTYVRRHFNVLPIEEAPGRLRAGTLPRRAAVLTFDDGTCNLATHAAPVLRELGLPAAVFLATGPMGTGESLWPDRLWLAFARTQVPEVDLTAIGLKTALRIPADRKETREEAVQYFKQLPDPERIAGVDWLVGLLGPELDAYGSPFEMLGWDDARELAGDGRVSLYPHTVTHPILANCSDEKVDYEITESCRTIQRETGSAPRSSPIPTAARKTSTGAPGRRCGATECAGRCRPRTGSRVATPIHSHCPASGSRASTLCVVPAQRSPVSNCGAIRCAGPGRRPVTPARPGAAAMAANAHA